MYCRAIWSYGDPALMMCVAFMGNDNEACELVLSMIGDH